MRRPLRTSLLIMQLALVAAGSCLAQAGSGIAPIAGSHAAGGASTSGGLSAVPEDFAKLKIASGFLLGVDVLEDSDFSGSYRVDQHGNISVTGLGAVHVGGESTADARILIRKALISAELLKDPRVNVTILEYTAPQVVILGEVASPGKYPLLAPRPLVDVLAMAGGETISAGSLVQITHSNGGSETVHYTRTTDAKATENVIINPGDTVQVNRAGIVYVTGAVNRPGGFVMQEEGTLNLLQAISLAAGTNNLAKTNTIYVLRKQKDGSMVYIELPYKKIVEGKSADVQLQAADIVYVPTSRLKSIYSNTQSIITSAAVSSIYRY